MTDTREKKERGVEVMGEGREYKVCVCARTCIVRMLVHFKSE